MCIIPSQYRELINYLLYQAPGEAKAELAELNRMGIFQAIITDSVDALVLVVTV